MEELRGLSCSVCYNLFKATPTDTPAIPRNLNCGHTYCTACLGKLASQNQYTCVRCPACKYETPLFSRFNGILSLPKNFGMLEIIEGKDGLVKTSVSATIDRERAKNKFQCEEHNEPKKVYCYTDKALICIYCQIYGKHQGHRCELASNLAKNAWEELRKVSKKLGDEHTKICKAKRKVTQRKEAISEKQRFLKSKVEKYMSTLRGVLGRRELKLKIMVDELITPKMKIIDEQEKSLIDVIDKCEELYTLIQRVQEDGDSGMVQEKPKIETLIRDITSLSEQCQLKPLVKDNVILYRDMDVHYLLDTAAGEITETNDEQSEEEEEGSDDQSCEYQNLLGNILANLEQVVNDAGNNNTTSTEPVETERVSGVGTNDPDSDDDITMANTADTSTTDEDEEEEVEEVEQEESQPDVDEDALVSEGELLGAVGGEALPEAQRDEKVRCKNDSKQGLLRELQKEIDRLRLLGLGGEVIRVVDDSSSSSGPEEEDETTEESENETPSLQVDFQIRVNNDLSRSRSTRALMSTSTSLSNEQVSRDHQQPSNYQSPRTPRKRCSALNCQYPVDTLFQCKFCHRFICRHCIPSLVHCNKNPSGHSLVKYKPPQTKFASGAKPKKGAPPKNMPRGASVLGPQWQCKRCTMLNEGSVLVCGACVTSKDFDPCNTRNVCPMCTLVNEPGKTNCELCSTDMGSQETKNSSYIPD